MKIERKNLKSEYVLDLGRLRGERTGMYLTEALFKERCRIDASKALFTMQEYDDHIDGLYSFYRLYMDIGDVTEYEVAIQLFGSTRHWVKLKKAKWFKPLLDKCRNDLKQKIRAEALKDIRKTAEATESDTIRLQALKFLTREGIDLSIDKQEDKDNQTKKGVAKRGRPSTEEVEGELKKVSQAEREVEEDYKRLFGEE